MSLVAQPSKYKGGSAKYNGGPAKYKGGPVEVGGVGFLPRFGPTNNDFTFEKLWFGSDTNGRPSHLATDQISNIYKLHKQSST